MQVMRIEINEMAQAFRVNGVTVAKRHLEKTISKGCNGDTAKMLARYLVVVPYLATAFDCPERASESVKYGAAKAKRLYKALKLTDDSIVPFMLVCMAQAGLEPEEAIPAIGREMRDSGFNNTRPAPSFQQGGWTATILPFPRKTLH